MTSKVVNNILLFQKLLCSSEDIDYLWIKFGNNIWDLKHFSYRIIIWAVKIKWLTHIGMKDWKWVTLTHACIHSTQYMDIPESTQNMGTKDQYYSILYPVSRVWIHAFTKECILLIFVASIHLRLQEPRDMVEWRYRDVPSWMLNIQPRTFKSTHARTCLFLHFLFLITAVSFLPCSDSPLIKSGSTSHFPPATQTHALISSLVVSDNFDV